MLKRILFLIIVFLANSTGAYTQEYQQPVKSEVAGNDPRPEAFSLTACLKYALKNQPALNQAMIDESIARTNNKIAFSSWLPQVNGAANIDRYFQSPPATTIVNGVPQLTQGGAAYVSIPSINVSQTIFSNDVLLAARGAKLNTLGARQNTANVKIGLISNISKAFYNLLLSMEQVGVYKEDTARLKKNQSDAYHQYVSGIVDKVDYKQATISLNNSLAQLKYAIESVDAKTAMLKQLMGYPTEKSFTISIDTAQMMQEVYTDTSAVLQFEKRIEYQQLQTAKRIQHETTLYYQLGFLPSLSAFYNYNQEYEAGQFSDLYSKAYPYSLIGLQLNIPLLTGFRRVENVHKAKLQEERTDWDEINLKLSIYSEYKQALANYKGNFYNLNEQRENVQMAKEVYDIVRLQYREGIKTYLDVITAEAQLQTSEINYLNALFQLLASKIDLEKAMGDIPTDI